MNKKNWYTHISNITPFERIGLVDSILREEGYFTPQHDSHEKLLISGKRLREIGERLPDIKSSINWDAVNDSIWIDLIISKG